MGNKGAIINMTSDLKPNFVTYEAVVSTNHIVTDKVMGEYRGQHVVGQQRCHYL